MEVINKVDMALVREAHDLITQKSAEKSLASVLTWMATVHATTNKLVQGRDFSTPTPENIQTFVLAAIVELTEFIQELNWKPWKQINKEVDYDKVVSEFADVLAFIGTLLVLLDSMGVDPQQVAAAYIEKELINVERFTTDY